MCKHTCCKVGTKKVKKQAPKTGVLDNFFQNIKKRKQEETEPNDTIAKQVLYQSPKPSKLLLPQKSAFHSFSTVKMEAIEKPEKEETQFEEPDTTLPIIEGFDDIASLF